MIAARVAIGFAFAAAGITGPAAPGTILLLFGVNRLVRTAVILARAGALRARPAVGTAAHGDRGAE